ncbi:hypothetical protein N665_0090s0032 [Sinapis alba]|nr:hypothetical protein N665_0090s0032 [Sinapis alba]
MLILWRKLRHDNGGRQSRLEHQRSIAAKTGITGEVAGCHGEESRSLRRIR